MTKTLVVSFKLGESGRDRIREALSDMAEVVFLADLQDQERMHALERANLLLARNTGTELSDAEHRYLGHLEHIQFLTAGVDHVATHRLPDHVPLSVNGGGYAEPMAEHALAMILAACKNLLTEHGQLTQGVFNQFKPNRMLCDMTAGILGLGGIGIATARVLRALGVKVHAINRRGHSDEPVDWIGGPGELHAMLAAVDILVLSVPLEGDTEAMIGADELAGMKPDAILVNLARGEIVDEPALYRHLVAHPSFTACIDAWWIEPVRHGEFRMDQPFLSLPNVIGSPHNSASVHGWIAVATERAVENCRRVLRGEPALHPVSADARRYRIPQTQSPA